MRKLAKNVPQFTKPDLALLLSAVQARVELFTDRGAVTSSGVTTAMRRHYLVERDRYQALRHKIERRLDRIKLNTGKTP